MKRFYSLFLLGVCHCATPDQPSLLEVAATQDALSGNERYRSSPYVTAGDRVYMVGHQDGSFPDLGWHIQGEMGGVWDHPIKLMDGFLLSIVDEKDTWQLNEATAFVNYPFGNQHTFEKDGIKVERFQFVPEGAEGVVISLSLTNETREEKAFQLLFTGFVDLRPTWLAERQNIADGPDEGRYDSAAQAFFVKDRDHPWHVSFGASVPFQPSTHAVPGQSKGSVYTLARDISLVAGETETLQFFIAGSYQSEEQLRNTYLHLQSSASALLQEKIALYRAIKDQNHLTTHQKEIDLLFEWTKYNTQWLVREVPEIGRGVSAGIPDYPWWFGTDNAYILQGMASAGLHEEALTTVDLIMGLSRKANGNGRIVHEVSSNGVVFNPGNLNTTPTFIQALWKVYCWTGSQKIIDHYYDDVLKGIAWIEGMDKDGNGYPDGAGMMEIHGLHSEMIDVVSYLAQAYEAAAGFAQVKGDTALAQTFLSKRETLIHRINEEWWVAASHSFADFRAKREETLDLIDAAILRADTLQKPWAVAELKDTKKKVSRTEKAALQGFVVHHNWVVNTPMEVGIADTVHAQKALLTAEKYQNRFGMFVTGIDRDETQEQAEKWRSFSYVGAVMTLPTGVQAIAEARYGNVDKAYEYLLKLKNGFSYALPGAMYEVSPDFGMMAQGWNLYAVAVPVVDYFFGIQPLAHQKKIIIRPSMPSSWHEASLDRVRIGQNEISISFERKEGKEVYEITQKDDWEISFQGATHQQGIIR